VLRLPPDDLRTRQGRRKAGFGGWTSIRRIVPDFGTAIVHVAASSLLSCDLTNVWHSTAEDVSARHCWTRVHNRRAGVLRGALGIPQPLLLATRTRNVSPTVNEDFLAPDTHSR
jgi:hypothetical protein